jgi:hypothetical protein
VTPRGLCKNRRFGGTYRLHHQGEKNHGAFQPVFLHSVLQALVTAYTVTSSMILVTLMMEALSSSDSRFLQEPHDVTSQETEFFIVTAVNTSVLLRFPVNEIFCDLAPCNLYVNRRFGETSPPC